MNKKARALKVGDILSLYKKIEEKSKEITGATLDFYVTMEVVAMAYDISLKEVEDMEAEEFTAKVEEVEKVNKDFFIKIAERLRRNTRVIR